MGCLAREERSTHLAPIRVFGFHAGVSEFELDRNSAGAPGASRAMALGQIKGFRNYAGVWEFWITDLKSRSASLPSYNPGTENTSLCPKSFVLHP